MDEENKLYFLREEIDSIDAELVILLESRLKLTDEIGKVKSSIKKPLLDEIREKNIIDRIESIQTNYPKKELKKLFKLIMSTSLKKQIDNE